MVHFDQSYAKIEIDQDSSILTMTWHGFANSEEFREARLKAVHLSRTYNVKKWLSNMKEMKAIRQADQDWSINDWLPVFQTLHLTKWAIVISDDMFNQMAMSSMMSKIRPKIDFPVEYFQDENSARSWLSRD